MIYIISWSWKIMDRRTFKSDFNSTIPGFIVGRSLTLLITVKVHDGREIQFDLKPSHGWYNDNDKSGNQKHEM